MPARGLPETDVRPGPVLPRFVGRGGERARLTALLAGPPRVGLIAGEAGIGKTRLLEEALSAAEVRPGRVLVAGCPPAATPFTLGAVVEGIRDHAPDISGLRLSGLAGALRPLFPEWVPNLPPPLEPAGDALSERHRLFRALSELLAALGVGVLALEDAHWADPATLEFLLFLAGRRSPQAGVVVTWRPEDIEEAAPLSRLSRLAAGSAGMRLTLEPLGEAATAEMISSMLGWPDVPGEVAEFLHRRTDGVPLMVEELVRLMHDQAGPGPEGWMRERFGRMGVPSSVRDTIVERVSRLDRDTQAVLRSTAILAGPATEATVAQVCGLGGDRVRRGLVAGLKCGLLGEDARGLVAFRHALAASAMCELTPSPERRALHLRAGRALEDQFPLPLTRLARHFREAGDTASWVRYGEAVADVALATGNEDSAVSMLFDLVTDGALAAADLARLVGKFPFGSSASPLHYQRLATALWSALDAGGLTPAAEADVRWQLARVMLKSDDYAAACGQLERAIPDLGHDPLNAGRAMIQFAQVSRADWPAATRLEWLRRGERLAAQGDPADRLEFVVDRAMTLLRCGEPDGWVEAAKIPAGSPDPRERRDAVRGLGNVSHFAMVWGRYGEARRTLAAALELAAAHGYTLYGNHYQVTRVHLDWFTGHWAGLAERAQAMAGNGDAPRAARQEAELVGGLLQAAGGSRLAAEERFRRVLDETRRHGTPEFPMEPAAALAGLLLAQGRASDALAVTDEPVAMLARMGAWIWATELMPVRVRALVATGHLANARDLATTFATWLDGRDAPGPAAAQATCRAVLAEAECDPGLAGHDGRAWLAAARLFGAAAEAWRALPRPYDALLAEEQRARCLLAAGAGEAAGLLAGISRDLTTLGAVADAGRIARLLRERGIEIRGRGWHGGRKGYGAALSPREEDVVRLLVTGRSNAEIAETLCKSPHTVGNQVKSCMRKLGVSTRTALAVRAVELGVAAAPGTAEPGPPAVRTSIS